MKNKLNDEMKRKTKQKTIDKVVWGSAVKGNRKPKISIKLLTNQPTRATNQTTSQQTKIVYKARMQKIIK